MTPFSATPPADQGDPWRYGVYLRPDPATCFAVTTFTAQLRAQYGFVSAGAFPPHATLVGSLHSTAPRDELVAALDGALAGRTAFDVHDGGIAAQGTGWVLDVHHRPDGTPNAAFTDLAAAVDAAVEPLLTSPRAHRPVRFDPDRFHAHLSLASHDLLTRPDLRDEVGKYLRGLPVAVPAGFRGDTVALYRTASADWTGRWWDSLRFEHLRTWRMAGTAPIRSIS